MKYFEKNSITTYFYYLCLGLKQKRINKEQFSCFKEAFSEELQEFFDDFAMWDKKRKR